MILKAANMLTLLHIWIEKPEGDPVNLVGGRRCAVWFSGRKNIGLSAKRERLLKEARDRGWVQVRWKRFQIQWIDTSCRDGIE